MKGSIPEKDYSIPKTLPHEMVQQERIVTSEGSRPSIVSQGKPLVGENITYCPTWVKDQL